LWLDHPGDTFRYPRYIIGDYLGDVGATKLEEFPFSDQLLEPARNAAVDRGRTHAFHFEKVLEKHFWSGSMRRHPAENRQPFNSIPLLRIVEGF
jgi:hypothetical protein